MPQRLLIVEDDSAILEILCGLLTDDDREIRTASDGRRALAVLECWRPDIALLDVKLPHVDGYEVAAAIAARYPETAIILMTASPETEQAAHAMGASFLAKPFHIEDLLTMIQALSHLPHP